MLGLGWISQNSLSVVETGSLIFAGIGLLAAAKGSRIKNHLAITKEHRELWSEFLSRPELFRVLEAKLDLTRQPITPSENLIVSLLIQNLNSSFVASKAALFIRPEKLSRDMRDFLKLPIPRNVWEEMRPVQDDKFVAFVERSLERK